MKFNDIINTKSNKKIKNKKIRISNNNDKNDDSNNSTNPFINELTIDCNPYLTQMKILKNKMKNWNNFFSVNVKDRTKEWNSLDSSWDILREKYAWAIPDSRSLNILTSFGPLIEIGGGKGYWAKLLQNKGCDIIVYDKYVPHSSKCWTKVQRGGPEKLLIESNHNRNLFLCYPDEQESQAIVCLENFKGEYIIHVGELMLTGTLGGGGQAPYGRTSSSEFQVTLSQTFHCLLVCNLEVSLPFGKDCISVWKRTSYVQARNFDRKQSNITTGADASDSVEFMSAEDIAMLLNQSPKKEKTKVTSTIKAKTKVNKNSESVEEMREYALDLQYLENDEKKWANIPLDEILPIDTACSSLKHLL
jgi:hypothetical protein